MTAEIVNLNKFRKAKERAEKDKTSARNREKFGRTRADRDKDADEQQRRDRLLDGARVGPQESGAKARSEGADPGDGLDPGNVS